jgi:hypothetical protein
MAARFLAVPAILLPSAAFAAPVTPNRLRRHIEILASNDPGHGIVPDDAAEDGDLMIALGRKPADPALYRPPAALARP